MAKQTIVKELLKRNVLRITGSYLIAGTSLVLFIDWLIARYQLPEYYVSIALFCLISILTSVIILAYFHGAPGKDEWTKIEKYGISINVLFIAVFLSISIRFDYWYKSDSTDSIKDNFIIHFSSNDKQMEDFLKTDFGKYINSYRLINETHLELIRKYVMPEVNSKIATLDIYPHYPENNKEYRLMEKLPMFNSDIIKNEQHRDSIPEIAEQYETKLNEINEVFDYFNNKYSRHIDVYILISIVEISNYFEIDSLLWMLSTIYRNDNRKKINVSFYGVSNNAHLTWNEDSLKAIYDEIVWQTNYALNAERFGGNLVGYVKDILDSNLISIKLKNNRILKGMKLDGFRLYIYNKGEETLLQYISDREDIIHYYKNNPNELEKLRNKQDWQPHHWYTKQTNIDALLSFFVYEIDSLKNNYSQVIEDWESKVNYVWDGLMQYELEIINISNNEAIGKIFHKKEPYVTPIIGDRIEIDN